MESKKSSILDLAGLLTHKQANELRKIIKKNRAERDKEIDERSKKIVKALENSKTSR